MSFVAVDLGASNTRFVSDSAEFNTIPNNAFFVEEVDSEGKRTVDMNPVDIEVSGNDIKELLEVTITHAEDKSGFFPMHALMGAMADSYSPNNEYPVAAKKATQKINYLSTIVAVAIDKLQHNLDDDITIYVALPPSEVKGSKATVKANLMGHFDVHFVRFNGGTTVSFDVVNVKCVEESHMAVTSYFFDINGKVRPEAKEYLAGQVLSLDIGASTTDLAIIKNGKYLDKSGRTYRTGGNVARDYLIEQVVSEFGYELPFEEANKTMAEGILKQGKKHVDVSNIINDGKKVVAESLVNSINAYFRSVNIPIQTIDAIIVSGGGSMKSQYVDEDSEIHETSAPMSQFITEKLKDICDGVAVESHSDSPRFANIKGMFIKAQFDMARQKAQQAQGQGVQG